MGARRPPATADAPASRREPRVILGVDPGTVITGYGLIRLEGNRRNVIAQGALRLDRFRYDQPARLKRIYDAIAGLIEGYGVNELAVEAPFFGTNIQSMLKLGRAQGVVMAAALARDLPVYEYPPARVKQSVTGRGAASKEQVRQMVLRLLPELAQAEPQLSAYDTTDALAVALCHIHTHHTGLKREVGGTKKSAKGKSGGAGWAGFVAANPDRVVKP